MGDIIHQGARGTFHLASEYNVRARGGGAVFEVFLCVTWIGITSLRDSLIARRGIGMTSLNISVSRPTRSPNPSLSLALALALALAVT